MGHVAAPGSAELSERLRRRLLGGESATSSGKRRKRPDQPNPIVINIVFAPRRLGSEGKKVRKKLKKKKKDNLCDKFVDAIATLLLGTRRDFSDLAVALSYTYSSLADRVSMRCDGGNGGGRRLERGAAHSLDIGTEADEQILTAMEQECQNEAEDRLLRVRGTAVDE